MWTNYEISSQLKEHATERRTATLLTCFWPSALKVFNSLNFGDKGQRYDIDIVLSKRTEFCQGIVNETYERYLFNTRRKKKRAWTNFTVLCWLCQKTAFLVSITTQHGVRCIW